MLCWDVNGLFDKLSIPRLIGFISSHDISSLVETWAQYGIDFAKILPKYVCFQTISNTIHKRGGCSGGVAV